MTKPRFLMIILLLPMLAGLTAGCSNGPVEKFSKPDIKDDFCGVVMNYQYCKCAFHNEFCDQIGLSSSAANSYVRDEYNKWLEEQKNAFKSKCELAGGIYSNQKCQYCQEPYYKEGNKCVKADEEKDEQAGDNDQSGFRPDGPFNADCSINEDLFTDEWRKYSDFDDNIDFNSRSWEVQQNLGIYEQIVELKAQNFVLQRDMEIDRQLRLSMREYKTALVQNIKTNLLKSFWRLSYITYSTIKSGKGVGESYSKVLTSGETLEVISQGLKVVQGVIPSNSSLAVDTSTVSGKVKSMGVNAALEALDSMGDPVKIATQLANDAGNAVLPSADITPEEVEILRTQHLSNQAIDQALQASYKANAARRQQLLENQRQIQVLEAQATSWEAKEKARVRGMLEADCQRQKNEAENKDTSLRFINIAHAQDEQIDEDKASMETLILGDYEIPYSRMIEEDGVKMYYQGDDDQILALSAYDTDADGQDDLWLSFDQDMYLTMEIHDTTGDGQPDTFVELDRDENVTKLVQPEPEIVVDDSIEDNDNIVVDIAQEESTSSSKSKTWIPILVVFIVLVAVIVNKKRK